MFRYRSSPRFFFFPVALILLFSWSSVSAASTAQANVLAFSGSNSQTSVISLTSDTRTIQTGYTNATYDPSNGVVASVSPGIYSVGFGSYVPENYTGPGAMYLHRVYITNQNGVVVLDESFDGWSLVSTQADGDITRSEYSTDIAQNWKAYSDTNDYYTGYGQAFAVHTVGADNGMVYPMDGGGPFSVLIRTLIDVPAGSTELRINVDWSYNVSVSRGEDRVFSIGLKQGSVEPEYLFSFSTTAKITDEDTTLQFSSSDFVDNSNNEFSSIRIVTLPDSNLGILQLSGQAVVVGDVITSADYSNLSFVPEENQSGETSFQYEPYYSGAYQTAEELTLTVFSVNDAPVIEGTPGLIATEDDEYSFVPTASDVDNDTLTFSIANKPSWANFNTGTGALTGIPTSDNIGINSNIVISVNDGKTTAALGAFSIIVENGNVAPTIGGEPSTSVAQGSLFSFTPISNDADGDSLTFSINNKPSWASFNTSTGALTGTPTNNDVGATSNIVISVSDGTESVSLSAFSLLVTNINDAPVISGTPLTTVAEDSVYSFMPAASDVDVGDSLTFSIANKPSWASFNTSTGVLTGTPTNDDVGTTNNIVISVSDGTASASLSAFSLQVTNVNDAPTISGTPATSVAQDSAYSFMPSASDVDSGDTLTYNITNKPSWADFNSSTGALTGMPTNDDVGTTSGIVISVNDGTTSTSLSAFSLQVTNINDAPEAVDDSYTLTATSEGVYTLDVLSNDIDVDGDTLILDWVTTSTGTATISDSNIVLTTDKIGAVSLVYSISDGNGGSHSGKATVVITPDTTGAPNITAPTDVNVNATALFTKVNLGVATATSLGGKSLSVSLVDEQSFFKPGTNTVYWSAKDEDGNMATVTQKVVVHPLVSISKDTEITEGSTHTVKVYLNGEAPEYPVTIPYTVSGTSDSLDHNLVDGNVVITSGTEGTIDLTTFTDSSDEGDETLIISLSDSVNLGTKSSSTLTITEDNIAPEVSINVTQNGQSRSVVDNSTNNVLITANVTDRNPSDTHTYRWINDNSELANVSTTENQFEFDPSALDSAVYKLQLEVTDSASATVTSNVYLEVVEQLTTLGNTDSDGDLIPDVEEGYKDTDNDGIPDYQDAISECNVIQERALVADSYLVEGEPGVCLRKGVTLAGNQTGGVQLLDSELTTDNSAENIGGIFDFVAYGLPKAGQTYQVVLPQRLPVPAEAVYRKYNEGLWKTFVSDADNYVSSTAGEKGYCPPPGDSSWNTGLTEGDWCVQLTIKDGGPNDDDGLVNGTIVDPGGVATTALNTSPEAVDDAVNVEVNGRATIDVLANDSDADGDALTINSASAVLGTVSIASNALIYDAPADYYGTDTITYSITDNNGGTAVAEVKVNIVGVVHNSSGGGSFGGLGLFVLGALAMSRRYGRKLLAASLALLSFSSQANWYLDADFGVSHAEDRMAVSNESILDIDKRGNTWSAGVGYVISPDWSISTHYLNLGEASTSLAADNTMSSSDYHQAVAQVTPVLADGITLDANYTLLRDEKVAVTAVLGGFFWKVDFDSEYQGTFINTTEKGVDPYIGLGLDYSLSESWKAAWEVNRYFIDLNDVTTFTIKFSYQLTH